MPTRIDSKDVEHVARLARLSLSKVEIERYGAQINGILQYIEKLNTLDTTGIEPTSHVLSLSNVTREDRVKPSLTPDEALGNAPDRSGDFYRVPKIIE